MVALLELQGYDARFASGGLTALDFARHWVPEIILLDISMPGHDGFQTAQGFRSLPTTRSAAIIAYTSEAESDIYVRALSAGFDAYCQKGTAPEALLFLIEALMR